MGTFGAKSLGIPRMVIQTLVERPKFFSVKYSKFDKMTLIVDFNGLLPSPIKRSLGNDLSTWSTWCKEPLSKMLRHESPFHYLFNLLQPPSVHHRLFTLYHLSHQNSSSSTSTMSYQCLHGGTARLTTSTY